MPYILEVQIKKLKNLLHISIAILKVSATVIGIWQEPEFFGLLCSSVQQCRIVWVYNCILTAVNNQNGPGCNARNISQWLNLAKTVSGAPPQQVICYPGKGSRRDAKCAAEIVINHPPVRSESAI